MQNTQKNIYRHYIALDWSQEIVAVAMMHSTGSKVEVKTLLPDIKVLKEYLKQYQGSKILTLEETTTSQWVYVELRDSVEKILVCDPYRNSLLKDGPKTDKLDAKNLCLLLRNGLLKEVFHSMDKAYEIRKLVSAYEDYVKASVRLKNQRSAIFRSEGKKHKEDKFSSNNPLEMLITESHDQLIEHFAQIRKKFEQLFNKLKKETPLIEYLTGVSGIGPISAVKIYAKVIDADRFENKYKYYGYCGLVRYQKESGGKNYGSRTIRHSKLLKSVYKSAAITAIGGNNDIRQYYEHLLEKKLSIKEARSKISRYIAKVTYAIMKNKTEYRPYQWRENK